MGRKLTQEEYEKKVFDKFGDEYSVLGEYQGSPKKIRVRHNVCGKESDVRAGALLCDQDKCSCLKKKMDLTGQRFGKLVALYELPERRKTKVMWHCVCDCGNEVDVFSAYLTTGHTKSCGCYAKESVSQRRGVDLVGQRFDRLVVLRKDEMHITKGGNSIIKWICQCDCGNLTSVSTSSLTHNLIHSCGCYAREEKSRRRLQDLSGQKFGLLTVIKRHSNNRITSGGAEKVLWECLCDCGNTTIVSSENLRNGKTASCGCMNSKNEYKIKQLLTDHGINYISQYKFPDCKNIVPLPFDFAIKEGDAVKGLIEYDGEGHYKPIPRGGMTEEDAQLELQNIHHRDNIKTEYCLANNIPLLRIPYWECNNLENVIFDFLTKILTP